MSGCYHTPRCGSASVHHARRNHDARRVDQISRVTPERPSRFNGLRGSIAPDERGVPSCKANPAVLRAAIGRAPWELRAEELEGVGDLWFELTLFVPGIPRVCGVGNSEVVLVFRVRLEPGGGPGEGSGPVGDAPEERSPANARR